METFTSSRNRYAPVDLSVRERLFIHGLVVGRVAKKLKGAEKYLMSVGPDSSKGKKFLRNIELLVGIAEKVKVRRKQVEVLPLSKYMLHRNLFPGSPTQ